VGESENCLHALREPGINLAVWKRPHALDSAMPALTRLMTLNNFKSLVSNKRDGHRVFLPHHTIDFLPTSEIIAGHLREILPGLEIIADDLSGLFRLYARILPKRFFRTEVRLEIRPAETKIFHTDFKSKERDVRLITSYYGPGTEWLENEGTEKTVGGAIAKDPAYIHRTDAGDVSMMRGGKHGIFHRSPIRWDTQTRVLAVIDGLDAV
jgi:hypothetical protein